MSLTRDLILAATDRQPAPLDVPEWGGQVFLRPMSGAQRERLETIFRDKKESARATVAAYSVCNEAGTPLFTDADIPALNDRSGRALDRIFAAALKLNGLGKDDLENAEKNSDSGRSGDSASA